MRTLDYNIHRFVQCQALAEILPIKIRFSSHVSSSCHGFLHKEYTIKGNNSNMGIFTSFLTGERVDLFGKKMLFSRSKFFQE